MESIDKIGFAIKTARKRNNMTQEQLAEALDITPTHVNHIESGRRRPSVEILFACAKLLDFSLDELIGNDAENTRESPLKTLSECTPRELKLITDIISVIKANR